ncbi:MAG: glycosyltransferase family 4 protein [Candidatus Promineifilaceae bacterium]|nr:glycosyltransferase family 4 protein [Candidatus Promineifilaceae bacterium]
MRVGLIIYGDLSITSGGYFYDRQMVNFLQTQGDKVEIISLPWQSYGRHLLDNLRLPLIRHIQEAAFDVLLQDELNHPSLFLLNRRVQKSTKTPLISIVHHLRSSEKHGQWQLKLYRRVERSYLRSVDGFIFNSKTTQSAVESLAGQQKPHIVANPSGSHQRPELSAEEITQRAHRGGPLGLLFVGNVIPRKGLGLILKALAQLPQGVWQLDIVGAQDMDAKYVKHLMHTADAGQLSANITWHGRLSDEDLAQRMLGNHILLMPSSYEGFGIAYLEGMALGLPSIGATSGAAQEIITDGQNGFIIAPDDANVLARHIMAVYQDRQMLAQMGIAALEKYRSHPTWETSMEKVRKFLLQFIKQREGQLL